jgi:hypothetical protein
MATPDIKLICQNSQGATLFSVNQTTGIFCVNLIQSNSTTGNYNINNQPSLNSTTASIIAYGGISIANTTNSSYTSIGGALTVAGGVSINKDLLLGGLLNGTTFSIGSLGSSISTGSVYIGGNATIGGNLVVIGTTTIVNETVANSINVNITASSVYITSGGLFATFNSNTIGSLFTTGGNVGINSTAPQASLQINGTSVVSPTGSGIFIGQDLNTYQQIQLNSTIGSYIDFSTSGIDFLSRIIYTNNNSSLVIQGSSVNIILASSGNVGINNNNPIYKLDINGTLNVSTSITTSNLYSTNTVITNSVLTNSTTTNGLFANLTTNLLLANVITSNNLVSTNVSFGNLSSLSNTLSNIIFTNQSGSTLNTSIGITSASLLITGLISSLNLTSTTNTLPNIISTNITTLNLLSNLVTTSNLISTNTSFSNLVSVTGTFSNKVGTNQTVGTINVTLGITTSNLLTTGLISSSNITSVTSTLPNAIFTNITSGSINTTSITTSNLSVNNIATLNLVSTNNTFASSNINSGIITNLSTTNATIPSLISINATISSLIASSGITTGNINFTGSLYQNGALYISSQWIGTTGNSIFYGSAGNVTIGIGTTNPTYTLDVNGTGHFTTGINTGTLAVTNTLNMYSSVFHNTYGSYLTNNTSSGLIYNTSIAGPILYGQGGGMLGYNGSINVLSWNSAGNVGISTTNQSYNLDVNGTTRLGGTTYISSGNLYVNNGNQIVIQNNTINTGVSDMIKFGQSDTTNNEGILDFNYIGLGNSNNSIGLGLFGANNKMVIMGSGFVGIGTTNPGTTLDVVGNARFTTSITTGNVNSTNITTTNLFSINTTLTNLVSTNNTIANLISTNLTITNVTGNNLLQINSTLTNLISTSTTLGSTLCTNIFTAIFNSNTVGNIFTTGGNVGINTTNPIYRFDITGTTRINDTRFSDNATTGALISSGGISILGTNSSSNSIGGALTISGGLAVSQDFYLGGNLYIQGVNSTVITGTTLIGSQSSTGVYQITVTIPRIMTNTTYKIIGNLTTTTANTNIYCVTFSSLTLTTFTANIVRVDTLFSGFIDPNLNLSWSIYP